MAFSPARAMPTIQSLSIQGWIPDQITNGQGKAQWRAIKARKAAKIMAWACARQAQWQFVPGRVRLSITYVFSVNRKRDTDNLYARSVGLINGLKGEWFTDDDTEHLDLHVQAVVEKGIKETRITLEPLD